MDFFLSRVRMNDISFGIRTRGREIEDFLFDTFTLILVFFSDDDDDDELISYISVLNDVENSIE